MAELQQLYGALGAEPREAMVSLRTLLTRYETPNELSWVLGLALLTAAVFAFGIGANDVANSFGTSVGSGALTMRSAVLIAAVMEVAGAVTLGQGVSNELTEKISDIQAEDCWNCNGNLTAWAGSHGGYREEDNRASLLVLAMFVSLLGGTFFLLGATYFKMPVSTTHTIVGSIVGTTIVAVGAKCVHWGWEDGHGVTAIAMSWVLSPLLSGIVSLGLFALVQRLVFAARDPVAAGLTFMPPAYGVTLFFLVFMILDKSSLTKGKLTVLEILAVAATTGGLAALAARLLLVPRLRRRTEGGKLNNGSSATKANPTFEEDKGTSSLDVDATEVDADGYDGEIEQEMNDVVLDAEGGDSFEDDGVAMSGRLEDDGTITTMGEMGGKSDDGFGMGYKPVNLTPAEGLFLYLQVFTAALKSFAHGANDTANAAGPLAAIVSLWGDSFSDDGTPVDCVGSTPAWIMVLTGVGIVVGLWAWGDKVMRTVGRDITTINFSKGFAIELGSALCVVLASFLSLPVSSTHCQIGSVVAVGLYEGGRGNVDWKVLGKIGGAWFVTLPISIGVSAGLFYLLLPTIEEPIIYPPPIPPPPPPPM